MKTKNSILKYIRLGLSARSFPELLHDVREKSSKLSLKDVHSFIVLILESWNATHHSDTEHRMTFQPWLQRHHLEVSNIVLMKINSACIWLKRESLQTLLTHTSPSPAFTSCPCHILPGTDQFPTQHFLHVIFLPSHLLS